MADFRSDAPWRHQFDNARDPYAARNALGIIGTGGTGTGPPGPAGPTGPTGPAGPTGPTGPAVGPGYDTPLTADQNYITTSDGTWTAWSPTITASSGALTSTTVSRARYARTGKTITAHFDFTITNAGTGTGALLVSLPVTVSALGGGLAVGRELTVTGSMIAGTIAASGTTINLVHYSGSTIIATNHRLWGIAIYEGA